MQPHIACLRTRCHEAPPINEGRAGSQLAPPRCRWSRSRRYSPGDARSSVATAGSRTSHSCVRPLRQGRGVGRRNKRSVGRWLALVRIRRAKQRCRHRQRAATLCCRRLPLVVAVDRTGPPAHARTTTFASTPANHHAPDMRIQKLEQHCTAGCASQGTSGEQTSAQQRPPPASPLVQHKPGHILLSTHSHHAVESSYTQLPLPHALPQQLPGSKPTVFQVQHVCGLQSIPLPHAGQR